MVQDTILGKSFGNFFVELKRRILVMSLIGSCMISCGLFQRKMSACDKDN